ncbi:DUF397 domain-containing protein [Streptosporangium roseum]|uniref:DUF397 domain-containing protein n=1 Tax=Streptosporangium roseum (strain ATCC 12428 / DSM 43021 / JCM 3005 / KCTC 9067 / NCIMB 10171 / NRRL 2505 / NI 9100) TaxID=479432 RepID=D2BFS1_STRRD|nr:DUF397 domain-containing protein [Streptosporangium roseum]ACZ90232.1 hypothetical protein Sros_7553 [Streptosporangium roseum DSM 43021]
MDVSRIAWRKSSQSGNGSNCVEVGIWHKSSLSGNGQNCVEVALADSPHPGTDPTPDADRLFLVRDSKDPAGPVLAFSPAEWDAFLTTIKDGTLTADRVL